MRRPQKLLEVLLLDDILVTLRRKVPEGVVEPIKIEVGDKFEELPFPEPWISADIRNDGPDPVYVLVNKERPIRDLPALEPAESLSVDMVEPLIRVLYLICDKGKRATVRIFGKR